MKKKGKKDQKWQFSVCMCAWVREREHSLFNRCHWQGLLSLSTTTWTSKAAGPTGLYQTNKGGVPLSSSGHNGQRSMVGRAWRHRQGTQGQARALPLTSAPGPRKDKRLVKHSILLSWWGHQVFSPKGTGLKITDGGFFLFSWLTFCTCARFLWL